MADEKIICQYCGKSFSKAGISNHEKSCKKNPVNIVEVESIETIVEVPVAPKVKVVPVKLKQKFECYIGDRYWRFAKGEIVEVPVNVKDILLRADLLEMI